MHRIFYLASFLLAFFIAASAGAQGAANPSDSTEDKIATYPKRLGWVNDYEKLLAKSDIDKLTKLILAHKKKGGNDIVVVTTKSYDPYHDMGSYAKDLATVWGMTKGPKDDGVILMISKRKGEVRITTGKDIRPVLTDTLCGKTIDNAMMKDLEQEHFGAALEGGLAEIIRIVEKRRQ